MVGLEASRVSTTPTASHHDQAANLLFDEEALPRIADLCLARAR
jgi:hypothetical protein